jgi:hypothetical protein
MHFHGCFPGLPSNIFTLDRQDIEKSLMIAVKKFLLENVSESPNLGLVMWVTPTSGVIGPVTYISSELLFQMVYKS